MAEHDSSNNEYREELLDVDEHLEREEGLITEDPFIAWHRRRAIREAEEARKWAEDNPDYSKSDS